MVSGIFSPGKFSPEDSVPKIQSLESSVPVNLVPVNSVLGIFSPGKFSPPMKENSVLGKFSPSDKKQDIFC